MSQATSQPFTRSPLEDFFGINGVDHIAMPGCLALIIGGSYPSGPTKADPPLVWQMIMKNETAACNVQSGIVFDMLRKAAGLRPGVLPGVGMDTFSTPSWRRLCHE